MIYQEKISNKRICEILSRFKKDPYLVQVYDELITKDGADGWAEHSPSGYRRITIHYGKQVEFLHKHIYTDEEFYRASLKQRIYFCFRLLFKMYPVTLRKSK